MSETSTVDMEARADIRVLQHKVETLSEAVIRHMDYEERQRDRMELQLDKIWRRVNLLSISVLGGAGAITTAKPLMSMVGIG